MKRWHAPLLLVLLCLAVPVTARAQSAADKATARELAAQGIKSLQAGNAEEAVKSLEKAQALYDAPIHLLYLGRAHTKLGNLVEAAEAYRSLVRAQLEADAPAVFKQAQVDGATELEALEPRIAKLTIEVEPEVDGLEVTVDDKPINTAALSVPRATNPGKRLVRARAPGYATSESEVTLSEGGSETVRLTLEPGESELGPAPSTKKKKNGADEDGDDSEDEGNGGFSTGPTGFIVGLRFGGVLPVGELTAGAPMTDYFQPGAAGRVELGFRFLQYLAIKGYFGMGALSPGAELNGFAENQDARIVTKNTAGLMDAGVALMGTTDPRILGGYGEVGFSFLHNYQWTQSFSAPNIDCKMQAKYGGWAVRAGGGMNIPTGQLLDVVPAVDVAVGQFAHRHTESDCEGPVDGELGIEGAATRFEGSLETALHYQIFLGVGLDLHFGDGLFR